MDRVGKEQRAFAKFFPLFYFGLAIYWLGSRPKRLTSRPVLDAKCGLGDRKLRCWHSSALLGNAGVTPAVQVVAYQVLDHDLVFARPVSQAEITESKTEISQVDLGHSALALDLVKALFELVDELLVSRLVNRVLQMVDLKNIFSLSQSSLKHSNQRWPHSVLEDSAVGFIVVIVIEEVHLHDGVELLERFLNTAHLGVSYDLEKFRNTFRLNLALKLVSNGLYPYFEIAHDGVGCLGLEHGREDVVNEENWLVLKDRQSSMNQTSHQTTSRPRLTFSLAK